MISFNFGSEELNLTNLVKSRVWESDFLTGLAVDSVSFKIDLAKSSTEVFMYELSTK